MSTAQEMTTADNAPGPILVLHLWGEPASECGICEEYGPHRHAVGWYCGPVKEDIGQPVPEWGPDAIAGGRTVCRSCHDRFYGIAPRVEGQKAGTMKLSKAQRRALQKEAFKPGEVHLRTVEWLLAQGLFERDGAGGMMLSRNMQGRGGHQNPLTYVRTKAGDSLAARSDQGVGERVPGESEP